MSDEDNGNVPGAPTGAQPPLVACLGPGCELEGTLRFRASRAPWWAS